MATMGVIVDRCFRENNLVPLGKTPTTAQATEALDYLNRVIKSTIGTDEGELLLDWNVPYAAINKARWPLYNSNLTQAANVYNGPPPNSRLILGDLGVPFTVYFQDTPPDGARMGLINVSANLALYPLTLSGNGRLIEGATTRVLTTNPTEQLRWLYRADLANWTALTFPLATTSEQPFPDSFDDFWVALLAIRLAPLYGKEPNVITSGIAQNGMKQFKTRYAQEVPTANFPDAAVFNSYQSYGGYGTEP